MKKFYFVALILLLACNSAPIGFYAPSGSTIELISGSSGFALKAGETSTALVSGTVKVPSGGEETIPGNDIYVQLSCNRCTIYSDPNGPVLSTVDFTQMTQRGQSYAFATDKNGTFQVTLLFESPADLNLSSYTATLAADILVTSESITFDVSDPDASE